MSTIDFVYLAFALVIGGIYLALAEFARRHRSVPGSTALAMIMLASAGYAVPYIFQLASPDLPTALMWYNLSLPGSSILGPAWLIFALQYTQQREILTLRRVALLGLIPLITCLAGWTNPLHNLYGTHYQFNPQAAWPALEWNFGFFYWLNFAYAYLTTLAGVVILLRTALRRFRFYTYQTILLLVGIFVPIVINVFFVLGFSPIPKMDVAPFLFLVTGLTWSLAIFRFHLLDIVPIAHERVFATMPVGMILLNLHRQVIDINPAGSRMMGLPSNQIIGKELPQPLGSQFLAEFDEKHPKEYHTEVSYERGGELNHVDAHLTPLYDNRQRLIGALLLLQDIALQKQAMEAERDQRFLAEVLRDAASDLSRSHTFEDVLDHILINLGKLVAQDAAHLVILNPTDQNFYCCRWLGAYAIAPGADNPTVGTHPERNCSPELLEQMRNQPVPALITQERLLEGCQTCLGREPARSSIAMPILIRGKVAGVAVIDSKLPDYFSKKHLERLDIFASQAAIAIENAWLFKGLAELAIRDELTGALNRRGLLDEAEKEQKRSRRIQRPMGIIMFDLDYLKPVNDTLGHAAGDIVLRTVVRQCLANIREIDFLGRYGGDEFVVLLPESDPPSVCMVAERLRKCVESYPINIGEHTVHMTISVGSAFDPAGEADFTALMENADRALYTAKQGGRNLVRCYWPNNT